MPGTKLALTKETLREMMSETMSSALSLLADGAGSRMLPSYRVDGPFRGLCPLDLGWSGGPPVFTARLFHPLFMYAEDPGQGREVGKRVGCRSEVER